MRINILKITSLLIVLFISQQFIEAQQSIVILHSNDTHSRVEPMPSTDKKYPNYGGLLNRKAIIDSIRMEYPVLLVDAGDFVQGTPYFTLFHGDVETKGLNMLGYEVGTIGNHEFDNGLASLDSILSKLNYPIVCANYDFSKTNTKLSKRVKPYVILKKNGLKIGIIGLGADPEGLIAKDKYEGMTYIPPTELANKYAKKLRKHCDIVILLTHIGINNDITIAKQSEDVDLIIGGHSHTYLTEPNIVKNKNGKDVIVTQAGKNGEFLGKVKIDYKK